MKPAEIARIVEQIDRTRIEEHFRLPDRPDARFVKAEGRVPPEVVRAQTRLRTAHWRTRMDSRRRPTLDQVGRALAVAFAGHPDFREIYRLEGSILDRAMVDLESRGFSPTEAQDVLRKLRRKLVEQADRSPDESRDFSSHSC